MSSSSASASASGARRCAVSGRGLFRGETVSSALLHFRSEVLHGHLGDHAAFAARKGGSRSINRDQNFSAVALALFPQGKGFLHCVFLAAEL